MVAPDLRGYGRSELAPDGDYSFRAMASDPAALMAELGFSEFAVVGHDRGARTAHRLAQDRPERVTRLALLDIMPTDYVYATVDRRIATAYYHWLVDSSSGTARRLRGPSSMPNTQVAATPLTRSTI